MTKTISDPEKRLHLRKLIDGFDTAMLVTRTADGSLRSRPLAIADDHQGDELFFSTGVETAKAHEIEADDNVNVTMQDKARFVSVTGKARLSQDRALIEKLWSEGWKVWFPGGKDDPSLRILIVTPSEASYWDASGIEGLKYLFGMAKAYVTGTRPASDDDEAHTGRLKM